MTEAALAPAPAPAEPPTQETEEEGKAKPGHVNEYKSGIRDPFTVAFNEAQDELADEDDEPKAKAKPKAKPAAKPEPKAEKPAKQAAEDAEEGEDGEEGDGDAEKAEKEKGPLQPKKWWPSRKREAFQFQQRHVQEAWLAEAPKPDQRWTEEQKAAFAKLQPEGQELVLERAQEIERGFGEKFEALANERKLAEGIRSAIPAETLAQMEQRGVDELTLFHGLLRQQTAASKDPLGYVRHLIAANKINPLDIIPTDGDWKPTAQPTQGAANPMAHPQVQAMAAELEVLRRQAQADRARVLEAEKQRSSAEFAGLLGETDSEGNSLYPFIRLMADPMATIIENEPDRFRGLGARDRLAAAYAQALEEFPELAAVHMTAPKAKADELKADNAESEESARAAKLEKAITPKSRATQASPAGTPGTVSIDDALNWASKKIGKR